MRHPNFHQCFGINLFANHYPLEGSYFTPRYKLLDKPGLGFGPGIEEIKGVRAHSHPEVAEMEVRATKDLSRAQVSEDAGVA